MNLEVPGVSIQSVCNAGNALTSTTSGTLALSLGLGIPRLSPPFLTESATTPCTCSSSLKVVPHLLALPSTQPRACPVTSQLCFCCHLPPASWGLQWLPDEVTPCPTFSRALLKAAPPRPGHAAHAPEPAQAGPAHLGLLLSLRPTSGPRVEPDAAESRRDAGCCPKGLASQREGADGAFSPTVCQPFGVRHSCALQGVGQHPKPLPTRFGSTLMPSMTTQNVSRYRYF